jgi:hypothetical protein
LEGSSLKGQLQSAVLGKISRQIKGLRIRITWLAEMVVEIIIITDLNPYFIFQNLLRKP